MYDSRNVDPSIKVGTFCHHLMGSNVYLVGVVQPMVSPYVIPIPAPFFLERPFELSSRQNPRLTRPPKGSQNLLTGGEYEGG